MSSSSLLLTSPPHFLPAAYLSTPHPILALFWERWMRNEGQGMRDKQPLLKGWLLWCCLVQGWRMGRGGLPVSSPQKFITILRTPPENWAKETVFRNNFRVPHSHSDAQLLLTLLYIVSVLLPNLSLMFSTYFECGITLKSCSLVTDFCLDTFPLFCRLWGWYLFKSFQTPFNYTCLHWQDFILFTLFQGALPTLL